MSNILPAKRRIIAIGDLHGDWKATILALKRAGVINNSLKWIGMDTVVVQIGDQVDKGGRGMVTNDENSELKIINLMDRLNNEAKRTMGAVYSLLGNHEIMNVMGDFTYVSPKGMSGTGGKIGRFNKFRPGGMVSRKLSKRNVIMKIGSWVFVHGGILPKYARKYSISDINLLMRMYLMGHTRVSKVPAFYDLFVNNDSLLWNRSFSGDYVNCKTLYNSLRLLDAKYMVVGHTPQENGINSRCNNRVWRIDSMMSEAFGVRRSDQRIQVLEILNDGQSITIL
jgi:hypothetical protein